MQCKNPGLEVAPLCAELGKATRVIFSSTVLAQTLGVHCQGSDKVFSLTGIQALDRRDEHKNAKVWLDIFGTDGVIANVDTVVTGISSRGGPFGKNMDLLAQVSGIDLDEIPEIVLGDIGGVLLPRKGLEADERYQRIANCWTGVSLEQLQQVAATAKNTGTPGVVVCAIGANKARVVLEAVALGVVQNLIIDEDLADGIVSIVDNI